MKTILVFSIVAFCFSTKVYAVGIPTVDIELFEGDKRLACEAMLCLPASNRPQECEESLKKFFSIQHPSRSKTVKKRKEFLEQCPKDDEDDDIINELSKISD